MGWRRRPGCGKAPHGGQEGPDGRGAGAGSQRRAAEHAAHSPTGPRLATTFGLGEAAATLASGHPTPKVQSTAHALQRIIANRYDGRDLPVTLVMPDGARRIVDIAEAMVGSVVHGRDSMRARWKLLLRQRRANRRNIAHHYDVSNAFYRGWLLLWQILAGNPHADGRLPHPLTRDYLYDSRH